jgi:hypothetical protein
MVKCSCDIRTVMVLHNSMYLLKGKPFSNSETSVTSFHDGSAMTSEGVEEFSDVNIDEKYL